MLEIRAGIVRGVMVAGLFGGMAMTAAAPTFAADKVIVNFNIFGPQRDVTKGVEFIADKIHTMAGEAVEVKIFYGAALGPERQTPESIKTGGYEGGQMCVGYYPNKFPLLSVMELPFLLPADIQARAKVENAVFSHPEIVKEMKGRWNMRYFAPALLPNYEFMGNKKIAKADDWKGVKVRLSGLNAKALQAFGAVPTMVTPPEGYTALERGTIDSFGFPYTYAFGAYKMYEVSKFVTEGIAMSGFICWQGISEATYQKLPDNVKRALPELQIQAQQTMIKAYETTDAKWRPIFRERLEMTQFPESEREKLAKGAAAFWDEWAKQQDAAGRPGRQILEFAQAEIAKATK